MTRCKRCGGRLRPEALTGLRICGGCGWGYTPSGRSVCPACLRGECSLCVSWWSGDGCSHECFYQAYYGWDVGYITADDF